MPRAREHDEQPSANGAGEASGIRPEAASRTSESFLLRFSAEPREARGSRRRLAGFVSRLGSGEEAYFSDVETLVAWLQARLQEQFGRPLDDRGPAGGDATATGRGRHTVSAPTEPPPDGESGTTQTPHQEGDEPRER